MASHVIDPVRRARAYLLRVAEPPAPALTALVAQEGPVAAAARVRSGRVSPEVAAETAARRRTNLVDDDFAQATAVGARLLTPEDLDEWPARQLLCLGALSDRDVRGAGQPLGLWVRGEAPAADVFDQAVSIIGAKAATGYGEQLAADIGETLGSAGMTVVSGAGYGIDGAAHRGALTGGGPTVAIVGCGIDIPYPVGHTRLLESIAAGGLVVTEYPPGTHPARHRFLVRNRLIASLSSATVVVEAGVRSGARNIATTAAALGKIVLAVPGPITSAVSVGCHDLIRTGTAQLVGSVSDIVDAVSGVHTGHRLST